MSLTIPFVAAPEIDSEVGISLKHEHELSSSPFMNTIFRKLIGRPRLLSHPGHAAQVALCSMTKRQSPIRDRRFRRLFTNSNCSKAVAGHYTRYVLLLR